MGCLGRLTTSLQYVLVFSEKLCHTYILYYSLKALDDARKLSQPHLASFAESALSAQTSHYAKDESSKVCLLTIS